MKKTNRKIVKIIKEISKKFKKFEDGKLKEKINKNKKSKIKKNILSIKNSFILKYKRANLKKEESKNIINKKANEKQDEKEELENLIEKTSNFNLENFKKPLEEIIPILKERGFPQIGSRIRNTQTTEKDIEQEPRIYDLPKTLAINQTQPKNYWENPDYLSSINKDYEIKQATPDGSSGKFVTSMENRSQISSAPISQPLQQSYETEQERKIRENRRRI